MKKHLLPIVVSVLMAGPSLAYAEAVQSTTSAFVSLRNCVAGETACDSIDRTHVKAIGGTPGGQEAEATQADPAFGDARGHVQLPGSPGAGEFTGRTTSLPAKRSASTVFALQRYTNSGVLTETLKFQGQLTFEQSVPEENAAFPDRSGARSGVHVEMELFSLEADALEAGTTAEDNFGIMDGEPPPGFQSLSVAATDGTDFGVTNSGERTFETSAVLQPGESIWMLTLLQTIAANGAEVDARLMTHLDIERH